MCVGDWGGGLWCGCSEQLIVVLSDYKAVIHFRGVIVEVSITGEVYSCH